MKNENQMEDILAVQKELNALYDLIYGGGLKQLEVYSHSPKSYLIRLKTGGTPEEISTDLVERFIANKEYDKDPGEDKWFNEIEQAKKGIIKIFEKLRKNIDKQTSKN